MTTFTTPGIERYCLWLHHFLQFSHFDPAKLHSTPQVRADLFPRPISRVLVTDFFGSVRNIELMNETASMEEGERGREGEGEVEGRERGGGGGEGHSFRSEAEEGEGGSFRSEEEEEGEGGNMQNIGAFKLSPQDHLVRMFGCS